MTKHITHTLKMTRPGAAEMDALYDLLHAAEAVDNRWSNETLDEFKERLMDAREDTLYENELAFLLKAWDVLTKSTSGGLGRLLGAFSALSATFSDESVDYVAASPAMVKMFNDSLIYPELVEGFKEALAHYTMMEFQLSEAKTLLRHTQDKLATALTRNSELSQTKKAEVI